MGIWANFRFEREGLLYLEGFGHKRAQMDTVDHSGHDTDWDRPDERLIAEVYHHLFTSGLTRERLRENAVNGFLCPQKFEFGQYGLVGRSLAWKTLLTPVPPLTDELSTRPIPPLDEVRRQREIYVELLKEVMRAPDGNYEEGFILPGQSRPPTPTPTRRGEFERNNPLSLDEQNPWKQWFQNMQLRKEILQDVQRTFPELSYFREKQVQTDLTNVLYLHAVKHSDIGYRQGMHELLAAIFLAVDYDSLDRWTSSVHEKDILDICDRNWVGADAWHLFSLVMGAITPWYEWRELARTDLTDSNEGLTPYTAPIVAICNRMQNQYLSSVDPTLWRRMSELGIEPQLYGIRWLRLIFTREFGFRESMVLWDGIFAVDPSLQLSQWVCVAMLVRIRNKLIPSDYSEQLTYLLRYSTSVEGGSSLHLSLLLQQAIRLSQDPNTSTGASIVLQNRNVLGIPIEVPEPPVRPTSRRRGDRPQIPQIPNSAPRTAHERKESQFGFPEIIARNILDKSESLGINRAIYNTVSDIRKSWNDLPAFSRAQESSSETSLPPLSQTGPISDIESPSEPRIRSDMEEEMIALRGQQRKLGRAVSWAVDSLLQGSENLDPNKKQALECLAYVRDVLMMGRAVRLEEDRLTQYVRPPPTRTESLVINRSQTPTDGPSSQSTGPGETVQSPNMMLSKRDSRPLTGLSRTPYIRREEPQHTSFQSVSISPLSNAEFGEEGSASASPSTGHNNARFLSSPLSPSAPSWQRNSVMSSNAQSSNKRTSALLSQMSTQVNQPPLSPAPYSPGPLSSGYPPRPAGGGSISSSKVTSPTTDPLGVLR
ncbi:hypothetical protein FRC20_004674 [Serendipita sp. 405]|nr:hypothetical protein FRC20_004674 [Serendipita sp. 405]